MFNDRIFILETKRQLVHLCLGLGISFMLYYLMPLVGYAVLIPLIIALVLLYAVPRKWSDIKITNHFLLHFERDKDKHTFPFKGPIYYGLGIIPPILFLPLEYACAVIAVLSVGDSVSTLLGKFFGRIRIGEKSLEGFLAFFIFGSLSVLLFVQNYPLALVFGFVGAILEFNAIIDDNLLIPGGLTVLYYIINITTPNLVIV